MDNKQLIHMACEGLVIGGVVLYFSKQMKTMNKDINATLYVDSTRRNNV